MRALVLTAVLSFGLGVVVTLLASIFECFVILPVHYIDFGQRVKKGALQTDRRGFLLRWMDGFRKVYERVLPVTLRHRYASIVVLLAVAVVAIALWGTLGILVLTGLVCAFWPQPVAVDLVTVERGPMAVTVGDEGETRITDVFVVSAPITGRARRIEADPSVVKTVVYRY